MLRWRYYQVQRTTLIVVGGLSFLLGLALPLMAIININAVLPIMGVGGLIICWRRRWFMAVPAVVVCGLFCGLWRGSVVDLEVDKYNSFIDHKVILTGNVVEDTTYDKKQATVIYLNNIQIGADKFPGKLRVTTFGISRPKIGDRIRVAGKLSSGFGNYQAAIYFAKIEIIQHDNSWIQKIRRQFAANVLSNLPEPQASLSLGFLLGIKSQLPTELLNQFKILGLTHVIVASGYNLTILVRLARRSLAGQSKFQATFWAGALMVGFVGVTGFSASMVRASLVTTLALAAWYYGRKIHPLVLLSVGASITAGYCPFFLWGDLGWWLSFLAFAGILLLAPLVQCRIFGSKEPGALAKIVLETVCAQILTLPLIIFVFGNFAVLSLVANILIVPLVPFVMLLTFLLGLCAWFLPVVAWLVAQPALWILTFMTNVVDGLAGISWASCPIIMNWYGLIAFYSILLLMGVLLYLKTGFDYLQTSIVE